MASDDGSGMREEFLAEAQEIVEALSRDLLIVDHAQKEGRVDPQQVNEIFRSVHTLKGIAGMFGHSAIGALAHGLEDLLDDLRLERVALTPSVLDVLFEGVEHFQRLLQVEDEAEAGVDFDAFAQRIGLVLGASGSGRSGDPLGMLDLDDSVLSVLTEYEEHRLRSNVESGVGIYRVRLKLPLISIDSSLEDLKSRVKPVGEIITYLPSMDGGDAENIELVVLVASRESLRTLDEAIAFEDASIEPVARRGATPTPPRPVKITDVENLGSPGVPAEARVDLATPVPPSGQNVSFDQLSVRSVAKTVRVDIEKLDHLMNVVGELAIIRSAVVRLSEGLRNRAGLRELAIDLHRINRGFERNLLELQNGILDVRMVPLGQIFEKLARIVRQVAREHGKEVRLVVAGKETEVDKLIVEELSDPLMHIIRNAIDHGIESPKVRELAEKPPAGTLALNAYQKGKHVVIEVEDDGAGINPQALRETAVRRGLLTAEAAAELTREEAYNLIFAPGFSTKSSITEISGRGVGMDVVKTNISRLGGVIDVQSEVGTGTKFTITLPVTLAMINALLVRVADRQFAVPITAVQEAIVLEERAIRRVEGREVLTLRGATLPICRLDQLFGIAPETRIGRQFIVVSEIGARRIGFVVDELHGQQDIVIKSLGPSLQKVRGFAGATDLGDQRVALVIDVPALVEELSAGHELGRISVGGLS
jgi:two-component system, chemotaxis family, sensor kinase CheA